MNTAPDNLDPAVDAPASVPSKCSALPPRRFRWWYKGRTPEGNTARFEGTGRAVNAHEAMNAIEKMMRSKHPEIVWMNRNLIEGNGLHIGPTIQMLKGETNKPDWP